MKNKKVVYFLLIVAVIILAILCLSSCTKTVIQPTTIVKTDTIIQQVVYSTKEPKPDLYSTYKVVLITYPYYKYVRDYYGKGKDGYDTKNPGMAVDVQDISTGKGYTFICFKEYVYEKVKINWFIDITEWEYHGKL